MKQILGNISTWIIEALEVHYGVNQKDMSVNLLREHLRNSLRHRFKILYYKTILNTLTWKTILDHSKKRGNIDKSLTKKDLIYPLNKWKNEQKNEIHNEY